MDGRYVALSDKYTLRRSTNMDTLYCLIDGGIYDLVPDQAEFIMLLDGTMTLDRVIEQYSEDSKIEVVRLLDQMEDIGAVVFSEQPMNRVMQLGKVPDRRLEAVHLEASGRCNMKCAHCYQSKHAASEEELSFGEILNVLDELQAMQVNNVGISGGEPLLMPHLPDIMRAIEERGMRISAIFTNGLLVDGGFIKSVKDCRSRFPIFVSLDSIPGMLFSFRGYTDEEAPQILQRIVGNIKQLVAADIKVILNTVVNAENIDNLNGIYNAVSDLGVYGWRIGFPKLTPRYKTRKETFGIEWSDIAEHCYLLLCRHLENGLPFHLQIEYLFREELFKQGMQALSDSDFACDYEGRRSECCIKPNGDIVSCAYCTDLPIGNVLESCLWDIWYSPEMADAKMIKIGDVAECHGCELRSLCGTGCRANAYFLHGDFENAKDDYACLAVKFFKERVIPLLIKHNFIGQEFSS